jgi:predicted phosphodiesterase
MPAIKPAHAKIVKQYLDQYPGMPSTTLAKMIYKNHEAIFTNAEVVRDSIRYFRKAHGDKMSKHVSTGDKYVRNSYLQYLPTEESEDYKPVRLNPKDNRIGVISDIHIPNHRNKPIDIAYKIFKEQKVNTILINGDLLDNTPFTKFLTPPDKRDARKYLDKAELFLENLRDLFPKARIIWLEGNHDYWYYQYLMRKAPEIYGDPYYKLEERLHLDQYKVEYIPQQQYLMAGKLAICHGHFLLRGVFTPVSAARTILLKAKVPVMVGHCHITSEHTRTDLHGDILTTWSTGCLCSLTPDYQPMGGEANHGFATVMVDSKGHFKVQNYRVHRGELL